MILYLLTLHTGIPILFVNYLFIKFMVYLLKLLFKLVWTKTVLSQGPLTQDDGLEAPHSMLLFTFMVT